ncbi:hypothetical protein D3C87_806350 [compost metagenome]
MSYAVTTNRAMSWLNNQSTGVPIERKTKGRKPKSLGEIVHPIFMDCSELTDDPYWKKIFSDASYNKLPRSFNVKNGQLLHKRGTKVQRITLTDNPVETLTNALEFFRDVAGMRSALDQEREALQLEEQFILSQSNVKETWVDVKKRKKCLSNIYITMFIHKLANEMNLSKQHIDQLTTTINLGFTLGTLTDDHVVFDGAIQSIRGLSFNHEKQEFALDLPDTIRIKPKIKTIPDTVLLGKAGAYAPVTTKVSFIDSWDKYLENLNDKTSKSIS